MKKDFEIIGYVTIFLTVILGAILARTISEEFLYNLGFSIGCFVMAGFNLIREAKGKMI